MLSNMSSRPVAPEDVPLISALHDAVFGPGRFARTAYRVREEMADETVSPYCRLIARGDRLIAALRMSEIKIGGKSGAVLLGPLVVDQAFANQGFGRTLVSEAIDAARAAGVKLVVLIGDEPYYGRFGFHAAEPDSIRFPGPVDPKRILVNELEAGAKAEFQGRVSAR